MIDPKYPDPPGWSGDAVVANTELAELVAQFNQTRSLRLKYKRIEDELRTAILDELGYDPDDPKPQPVTVYTEGGKPILEVAVASRRTTDTAWLRENYPDLMALAERVTPTKTLKDLS